MNHLSRLGKVMCAALAALALCVPGAASAADYPSKPISIVCAFGAGTGADLILRPAIPYMKEVLGTDVITEYKAGSAGIVGANYFATKRPDGYSLLFYNQPHILLQEMFMKTAYKTDDLVPVLGLTYRPDFLIVRSDDSRFKTAQDVFNYAKANPGKLTVGTVGMYSGNHLTYLLLEKNTGLKMTRVPFESGGKMFAAILGGQVDVVLSSYMWVTTYEGKLTALASATQERLAPDVPTFIECGVNNVYGSTNSNYVFVSKKAPKKVIDFLRERLATLVHNEAFLKDFLKATSTYDCAVYDWKKCEEEIANYRKQIASVEPMLREAE